MAKTRKSTKTGIRRQSRAAHVGPARARAGNRDDAPAAAGTRIAGAHACAHRLAVRPPPPRARRRRGSCRAQGAQEAQAQCRCPPADCRGAEASLGKGQGRQGIDPPQSRADCAASSIVPAWMRTIASTSGAYPPAMVTATGTRSARHRPKTIASRCAGRPRSAACAPADPLRRDPHRPRRTPVRPGRQDHVECRRQCAMYSSSPAPSGSGTSRSLRSLRNGKLAAPCSEQVKTRGSCSKIAAVPLP